MIMINGENCKFKCLFRLSKDNLTIYLIIEFTMGNRNFLMVLTY